MSYDGSTHNNPTAALCRELSFDVLPTLEGLLENTLNDLLGFLPRCLMGVELDKGGVGGMDSPFDPFDVGDKRIPPLLEPSVICPVPTMTLLDGVQGAQFTALFTGVQKIGQRIATEDAETSQ